MLSINIPLSKNCARLYCIGVVLETKVQYGTRITAQDGIR